MSSNMLSETAGAAAAAPAADPLAVYVSTVPRGLRGDKWARWRRKNPPPYLRPGARRNGRCTICGGELGAVLGFCYRCTRREFDLLAELPAAPRLPRPLPSHDGRRVVEEWREYPQQGPYRPADRRLWFVVRDEHGAEITRSFERTIAERYL